MTLSFINEMKDKCQAQLKEASKATKRPDYNEKTNQKFKFSSQDVKKFTTEIQVTQRRFETIESLLTELNHLTSQLSKHMRDFLFKINDQIGKMRIGVNVTPFFEEDQMVEGEATFNFRRVVKDILVPFYKEI